MVKTESGVGVVDPGKRVPDGPIAVLSKDDMKTLDSFWRDTARQTIKESQVTDAAKDQSLRLLTVMIIGIRRGMPMCGDLDLHAIRSIDPGRVPASISTKAKVQVPAPSFTELWSVNVCDDEEKWLVIGANGLPFITVAPSSL